MDKKQIFFQEIDKACAKLPIKSKELIGEISDSIGSDEVVDYYMTFGPFPDFPETILDLFILTREYLFNFELIKEGSLRHFIPLNEISAISESFSKLEDQDFIAAHIRHSSLYSTIVFDKLINKENQRKFLTSVTNTLLKRQRNI